MTHSYVKLTSFSQFNTSLLKYLPFTEKALRQLPYLYQINHPSDIKYQLRLACRLTERVGWARIPPGRPALNHPHGI